VTHEQLPERLAPEAKTAVAEAKRLQIKNRRHDPAEISEIKRRRMPLVQKSVDDRRLTAEATTGKERRQPIRIAHVAEGRSGAQVVLGNHISLGTVQANAPVTLTARGLRGKSSSDEHVESYSPVLAIFNYTHIMLGGLTSLHLFVGPLTPQSDFCDFSPLRHLSSREPYCYTTMMRPPSYDIRCLPNLCSCGSALSRTTSPDASIQKWNPATIP
jgi:hypothetical protein